MLTKAMLLKAAAVTVTAAVAGTVAFVATSGGAAAPPAAQAWIDNPLDGATVALAPLSIIAHAYDPDGVAEVVLVVNGQEQQIVVPDGAGQRLVYVQLSWTPQSEGSHSVTVYGRDGDGEPGLPGHVVVLIHDRKDPTPSQQPSPEATPSASPTPTTTPPPQTTAPPPRTPTPPPTTPPCTPPAPVLLQPSDGYSFGAPGAYLPTFSWSAWRSAPPACPPSGFRIELQVGRSIVSGDLPASETTWQPPAPLSCGSQFTWRVGAKRSDGAVAAWSPTRAFTIVCTPT